MSWTDLDHHLLNDGINRLIREQKQMNEHLKEICQALMAIAPHLDPNRKEGECGSP